VLESQDLHAEIVKGIKNAMTERYSSEDRKQSTQWRSIKEDVRNIGDSLKSRYYIELRIKNKGTPFLQFELSKFTASLLHLPRCDEHSPETQLASLVIRDICLTN
jgi:hypothetical protein